MNLQRSVFQSKRAYLLLALYIATAAYFFVLFGSINDVVFCCDATLYVRGSELLQQSGVLADTYLSGYRPISNYAFVAVTRSIGLVFADGSSDVSSFLQQDAPFVIGSIALMLAIGTLLIVWLGEQKGFMESFCAIFLNPLVFAHVPVPLQESQMVLVLGPLVLVSYVMLRSGRTNRAALALMIFAAAAWMTKPSFILCAAATLALAVYVLAKHWNIRSSRAMFAGLMAMALIVFPQIYAMKERLGTFNPYPNSEVLNMQLSWGNDMWRYETHVVPAQNSAVGLAFETGFPPVEADQFINSLSQEPVKAISLFLGHIVGALDYTHLTTYIHAGSPGFPPTNIAVGAALFLALILWITRILERRYGLSDLYLDILAVGAAAPLLIAAVETRFSLPLVMAFAPRTIEWFTATGEPPHRKARDVFGALVFGLVFATAIAVMRSTVEPFR